MARTATATTREAGSAILGAGFWEPGKKISGIYVRTFVTKLGDGESGECHQFLCLIPQTLKVKLNDRGRLDSNGTEQEIDKFSVGALTGIEMALDALRVTAPWFGEFKLHDKVQFECIGIQPGVNGNSPMPEFSITVERG